MGVVVSRVIGRDDPGSRAEITALHDLRLVDLKPVYFTRKQELAKRVFDIAAASLLLITASPVLVLCALIMKLTSAGPVLYRSLRVGRGGRHFEFLKIRSMYAQAPERDDTLARRNLHSGHLFKIRDDPRVTPFGRFMRRYSLDELPQLINVLSGDMSLVGPRPLPSQDLDPDGQSRLFATWAEQRSRVLPGITGLWQIRGRSTLPFEQMVELDLDYIRNWSLLLDLAILLRTPVAVFIGKGAF
jgi:lipopolysaccharide/colanic/teichoic acid biosynthesis glycosyltransferase